MTDTVIFAPLGPNPAPLTELIWALFRQRQMIASDVFIIVDREGRRYLEGELLGPRGILAELRRRVDSRLAPQDRLHIVTPEVSGAPLEDDAEPEEAKAYQDALWQMARDAVTTAHDRPLVFACAAGRRRTMTALVSSSFQLLGRKQDCIVDVRVSDRRVEGGTGFYYPEQEAQMLQTATGLVPAESVSVRLVDLALPRVGGLGAFSKAKNYAEALAKSQEAIDELSRPRLVVNVSKMSVTVDGDAFPLSKTAWCWFAYLAWRRTTTEDGWTVVAGDVAPASRQLEGHQKFADFLTLCQVKDKLHGASETLIQLSDGNEVVDRELAEKVRASAKRAVSKHKKMKPGWQCLVPEVAKGKGGTGAASTQRLPLEPEFIELMGWPDAGASQFQP